MHSWSAYYSSSRCHFSMHDKTMLIGADSSHITDRCIRVTIHHCFFDGTRQRHPRLRFGKVHLYNNYTRNWGIYAVCASVEAQVLLSLKFEVSCLYKFLKFWFSSKGLIYCLCLHFCSVPDSLSMQYIWSRREEGGF